MIVVTSKLALKLCIAELDGLCETFGTRRLERWNEKIKENNRKDKMAAYGGVVVVNGKSFLYGVQRKKCERMGLFVLLFRCKIIRKLKLHGFCFKSEFIMLSYPNYSLYNKNEWAVLTKQTNVKTKETFITSFANRVTRKAFPEFVYPLQVSKEFPALSFVRYAYICWWIRGNLKEYYYLKR